MKTFIIIIAVIFFGAIIHAQQFHNEEKILLASNSSLSFQNKNDSSIEIESNKTEYIQGESIDVILKIKNNTNENYEIAWPKNYLLNLDKNKTFTGQFSSEIPMELPPKNNYYFFDNPEGFVLSGTDPSTNILPPGNYEYYASLEIGNNKYISNKINFKINPVSASLQPALNELRFVPGKSHTIKDYELLAEKYKGTVYERIFLRKLIHNSWFTFAIQNKNEYKIYREKAIKLYKKFILSYPDTYDAYSIIAVFMSNYNANKIIIDDILKTLIKDKPNCKLLEVLRNQPDYMNKQIKYLLK